MNMPELFMLTEKHSVITAAVTAVRTVEQQQISPYGIVQSF